MVKIPSMLVQPYVENAIIHGLLNKNGQGYICISMDKNENEFICKIEDNGIGRKAAQLISKNKNDMHESLGIKVNEERTKIIESLTNKKTSIHIVDLYNESGDAKGTQVVIKMYIEDEYD
jgi:sensor histidine kinase YesM